MMGFTMPSDAGLWVLFVAAVLVFGPWLQRKLWR